MNCEMRLGLMTIKGTRHVLCSVGEAGPDIWICWPTRLAPYRLALTIEESRHLRGALYQAERAAKRVRQENAREMRRRIPRARAVQKPPAGEDG